MAGGSTSQGEEKADKEKVPTNGVLWHYSIWGLCLVPQPVHFSNTGHTQISSEGQKCWKWEFWQMPKIRKEEKTKLTEKPVF